MLLDGGADPDARYRLPDRRTVTPLTWATLCIAAGRNDTGLSNELDLIGGPVLSIQALLYRGAVHLTITKHVYIAAQFILVQTDLAAAVADCATYHVVRRARR